MGGMISYIMRNSVINQSLKCMKFRKIYQKKKKNQILVQLLHRKIFIAKINSGTWKIKDIVK